MSTLWKMPPFLWMLHKEVGLSHPAVFQLDNLKKKNITWEVHFTFFSLFICLCMLKGLLEEQNIARISLIILWHEAFSLTCG